MWQLACASTLAVLIGLLPVPYGFYMILRIVVCLTAAVGFANALSQERKPWLWIHGVLAVLYNPVLPVHLGEKGLWVIVNLVTLVLFWVYVHKTRASATGQDEHAEGG